MASRHRTPVGTHAVTAVTGVTAAVTLTLLLAGCAVDPVAPERRPNLSAAGGATGPIATGSGHWEIDLGLGGGVEQTTFTFNAVRRGSGGVGGHFVYNLRAGDVTLTGSVTCATVAGNQVWVGGVIDKVKSADPADHEFLNTEVWWRSVDNGEGDAAPPDLTSSVLLTLPTTTITAESWCRLQPAIGRLRPVIAGNIQVH